MYHVEKNKCNFYKNMPRKRGICFVKRFFYKPDYTIKTLNKIK